MNLLKMKQFSNEKQDEKHDLLKIFILALAVRLVVLSLVYLFKNKLDIYLYIDDLKYEDYAILYAGYATKFFDLNAMRLAELGLGGKINVAQLFFNYNALLLNVTGSKVILRLSNIVLSSLTVIPIFYLTKELFSKKEGFIAALIFGLIPYNVIMSVFLFKDIMIVLILSTQLYFVIKYFNTGILDFLYFLLLIPMPFLRDGISLFVIGLLFLAFIIRNYHKNRTIRLALWFGVPIISLIGLILFQDTIFLLMERFNFYIIRGRDQGEGINLIRVDSLKQLYKLPLTWMFSTFFPISFTFEIHNWADILGLFNYSLFLISPAYLVYMMFSKKEIKHILFFFPMLLLHLLVIILVINIPRHYYFLNFYIIIGASAYLAQLKTENGFISYGVMVAAELFVFMLAVFLII